MAKKKHQDDQANVNPDEENLDDQANVNPDADSDEGNGNDDDEQVDGGEGAATDGGKKAGEAGGNAHIIPANFSVVQRFRVVKDGQDKEFVEGDTLSIEDVEFLGVLFDERLANGHIKAKLAV